MKLVVGGAGNGKLEYVLEKTGLGSEQAAADFEHAKTSRIFYGLQDAVRTAVGNGEDPQSLMDSVLKSSPDIIVICDEVGSGVVPAEPEERKYREAVGRLCCRIAKSAGRVERIICGIPTVLKDDEEW